MTLHSAHCKKAPTAKVAPTVRIADAFSHPQFAPAVGAGAAAPMAIDGTAQMAPVVDGYVNVDGRVPRYILIDLLKDGRALNHGSA